MADRTETLTLRVLMDDSATLQLEKIKQSVQGLTTGQTRDSLEKFRRSQNEMGEQIKKLTEAMTGGEKAMLGYVKGFGLVGFAVSALGGIVTSTSQKIADLSTKAATLGVPTSSLKNLIDQMVKAGVPLDVATRSAEGFSEALVDLGRIGSKTYEALISKAENGPLLARQLADMRKRGDLEGAYNVEQELAARVEKNRFEERHKRNETDLQARMAAAQLSGQFLQDLRLDPITRLLRHAEPLNAAQKKAFEETEANAKKVAAAIREIGAAGDEVADQLVKAFGGPVAKVLQSTKTDVEAITKLFEATGGFLGKLYGPRPPGAVRNMGDLLGSFSAPGWMKKNLGDALGLDKLPEVPGAEGGASKLLDWNTLHKSENIEDRRDFDDSNKMLKENTAELKKLNDHFSLLEAGGTGGGGGLGGGGGGYGGGLGGGSAPYGSDVGPGRSGGGLPSMGGGSAPLASAGAHHFGSDLDIFTRGAGMSGGSAFLKAERAPLVDQLNADPQLKRELAATAALEHESDATAVVESLYNRTTYVNQERAKRGLAPLSLRQMLHSGFYGPINRGALPGMMGRLAHDPARMGRMMRAIDAAETSNLVKGYTDQGSRGDPNYYTGGTGVNRFGERYNLWGGGPGGHAAAEQFRLSQQAAVERGLLDARAVKTVKVEGSGTLTANIRAPRGTDVTLGSSGLFKKRVLTRQTQMAPAAEGPDDRDPANNSAPPSFAP
jgi:hypothetical protein